MTTTDAAGVPADGMDSLMQPWQQLAVQLRPLIGESGFCALYVRSARLAAQRFGRSPPALAGKSVDALLASLRAQFATIGHAEAVRANDATLHTFTQLLAGLIGEALTMQLLDSAPAGENAMPVQEQQ